MAADRPWDRARRLAADARDRAGQVDWSAEARKVAATGASTVEKAQRIAVERAPSLVRARTMTKDANSRVSEAVAALETAREEAQDALAVLGALELDVYDGLLRRFTAAFSRVKNVDLTDVTTEGLPPVVDAFSTERITVDYRAVDALKTAVMSGGSGAAAGLITFASVGTFATASTGTAIGTLSGAAATNATLAWLGGGSLAAGGMGMAGGMIVLGGLVAAPVLAVGGLILRQQGRKALATAQADALEAEKAIAEMRLAEESTRGITERAEQLTSVLQRLRERALEHVAVFEFVLEEQDDYLLFSDRERAQLASTVALVKTARAVIDVPVIDADGNLTPESAEAVVASQAVTTTHAGSA